MAPDHKAFLLIMVTASLFWLPHSAAHKDTRLYPSSHGPRTRRSAGGGNPLSRARLQRDVPDPSSIGTTTEFPETTTMWSSVEDSVAFVTEYLANEFEAKASAVCNKAVVASWELVLDLSNKEKEEAHKKARMELSAFEQSEWEKVFQHVSPEDFEDPVIRRQVEAMQYPGVAVLNKTALNQLNDYEVRMQHHYSTSKVCPFKNQNCNPAKEGIPMEPDIEEAMLKTRDPAEMEYLWTSWHNSAGAPIRKDYRGYVDLQNMAARLNGFDDMGVFWQAGFDVDDLRGDVLELWDQVEPLYRQLHLYVGRKLREKYGDLIPEDREKPIPAHMFGNMWGLEWTALYDLVVPYPNASSANITKSLKEQKYTTLRMFQAADDFYQSMGLEANAMSYGPKALIEKIPGREMVCHASAWDFCDRQDFRIKMCTQVKQEDFQTIHHEMGHIQYYIQYRDQPYALRSGASPGFHEAIGDTIALSVNTPKHLKAIGLLDFQESPESSINALMKMALDRVAFLPFGLLVDLWRWDVFSGNVTDNEWNSHWWRLREKYQRMSPPVPRDETHFDPGAKFHVPAGSEYISYFVAHILQFQLYRAMCIEAGQVRIDDASSPPLHQCDLFNSKEAGRKFSEGLRLGSSVHWKETLRLITGEDRLNASALLEYFQPLYEFLLEANGSAAASNPIAAQPTILAILGGIAVTLRLIGDRR